MVYTIEDEKMNVFQIFEQRGFIYQCTDRKGLKEILGNQKVTCYIGFDPTAPSLHVGSLIPIIALKYMEMIGHRPIAVIGGGTALVGDPSGKTEMRRLLSEKTITENTDSIKRQLESFLDVKGGRALLLNNKQWLAELSYIEFLRTFGRHISVNKMLSRESAKLRFNSKEGLSLLEFNYACLQAYDFYYLARNFGCSLQMGGQDQWGNICEGIDLIAKREFLGEKVFGLTFPLLLSSSGEKFGKTAKGTVWLDPELTTPFDFYQFWRNIEDKNVEKYLLLFTFLPYQEVRELGRLHPPLINRAKEILAFECTSMVHGFETACRVYTSAIEQFGEADPNSKVDTSSKILQAKSVIGANANNLIPSTGIKRSEIKNPISVLEIAVRSGLCKSKSEARRLIRQGGIYINNKRVNDENQKVGEGNFINGELKISIGKKNIRKILINQS